MDRRQRAFHVFGLAGLALSLVVCVVVLAAHDVALWALPVIAGTAVATFLALAMAVKVATGRESFVDSTTRSSCSPSSRARCGSPDFRSRPASTPPCSASAPSSCSGGSVLNAGCCTGVPRRAASSTGPSAGFRPT